MHVMCMEWEGADRPPIHSNPPHQPLTTQQTKQREQKVHVFEARGPFVGEPAETEEMRPQWYEEGAIPYDKMWADDKYWVPMFLEGKRFQALFEFDDESTILRYDLRTLGPEEELVCE